MGKFKKKEADATKRASRGSGGHNRTEISTPQAAGQIPGITVIKRKR